MASQRSTRYSSRRQRDGAEAGIIDSASGSIGSSQYYCTELDQNPRLDADGCGNDGFANYDAASQGTDSLSLPSVATLEWNRNAGQRRRGPAATSAAMLTRGGGGMNDIAAAAAAASRAGKFVEQTTQTNTTVMGDSAAVVGTAAAFTATGKSRLSAAGVGTGLSAGGLAGQEAQQLVQRRSALYMPVGGRQNCVTGAVGPGGPGGGTIPGMGLLDTTNVDPQQQPGGELVGYSNEELKKLRQLLAAEEARRGLGGGRSPGGTNTSAASGMHSGIGTGGSGEDEDANSDISSIAGIVTSGAAGTAVRARAMMPSRNPGPAVAASTTSTAESATESALEEYQTKLEQAEISMAKWHGVKLYQLKEAKKIWQKVRAREVTLGRMNPKMTSSSVYKRAKAKELAKNPDAIFSAQVEWTKNNFFDATSAIGTIMHRIKMGIELPQAITGCPGGQRPSDNDLLPTRKENDAKAAKYYNDFILRQIRKECGLKDDEINGTDNDASNAQATLGAVPDAAPSNAIGHAGAPLAQGAPFASPHPTSKPGISGTAIPDVSTIKVSSPGSISAKAAIQLESGVRKAQVDLNIEHERSALERQLAEEEVDRINEEKGALIEIEERKAEIHRQATTKMEKVWARQKKDHERSAKNRETIVRNHHDYTDRVLAENAREGGASFLGRPVPMNLDGRFQMNTSGISSNFYGGSAISHQYSNGAFADSAIPSNLPGPFAGAGLSEEGRNLSGNKFKCGDYVLWKNHYQKGRIQGDGMVDGKYHVAVQENDGIEVCYAEEDELDFDPDSHAFAK